MRLIQYRPGHFEILLLRQQHNVTLRYDTSADIWSFGILLYELATGKAPYANMSLTKVILTTLHEEAPSLNTHKRKFSEVIAAIVAQCSSCCACISCIVRTLQNADRGLKLASTLFDPLPCPCHCKPPSGAASMTLNPQIQIFKLEFKGYHHIQATSTWWWYVLPCCL